MIEDVVELINSIEVFIYSVEKEMNFKILSDVRTGIIMHITFLIDQLVQGKNIDRDNKEINEFISSNSNQIFQLSELIKALEEHYQVNITDDEKAYILKMFKKNSL
jgi:transcriptional regulatory protein LevR